MNMNKDARRSSPRSEWNLRPHSPVPFLLSALRMTVYAVLAVLRPFIVLILSAVTIVGLILCLFYGLLTRGTHFPTFSVLAISIGSAVLIVVFYALMDLLLPQR